MKGRKLRKKKIPFSSIPLQTGANKQEALEQIFAPDGDGRLYPARLIQPEGELWWLLDEDAGAKYSRQIIT